MILILLILLKMINIEMKWKKINILIIPISVNTKENSITMNKYIIYSKEYHLFESILYYLNNQKKKKIKDNECYYKYNFFWKIIVLMNILMK